MNENNQEKTISSAKYIQFKAIQKPSFYGIPYTENSPEFELLGDLDQLGWEIEGDFYRSKDILKCETYLTAQKKFLKAAQDSQGYQLDIPPFSILEIRFLLRAYCTELRAELKIIGENKEARIYLDKKIADALLDQIVIYMQEPSSSERMQKIYDAQKNNQPHEVIYHCGQFILERQHRRKKEDLHIVHWVRAVAFEKMSKDLLKEKPNDTLCYYTAFYYCLKSNLDLLDTLKIAERANEQSYEYIEKIKPLILTRLKNPKLGKPRQPLQLNKKKLYFLQLMHIENNSGIQEKTWLFKFLKETLYPEDISVESRYLFLINRGKKIEHAYSLIYEGNYEKSIQIFLQLLNNLQGENLREHADYYERLAYLYIKLKQWENAQKACDQSQQICPIEMSRLSIRADIAYGQGLYIDAIINYKRIVSLAHTSSNNPTYTKDEITTYFTHAVYKLGRCFSFLNQHEKAIQFYLDACEKFEKTGFDKIKPSVFIQILHSQNCLFEQNAPLEFSGKINDRKIFFYAIQNTYQYAEKLLLKTFQILPNSAFKSYFCDQLTLHFLENKEPAKLVLLCRQLAKHDITLSPGILINLLNTLSTLECPQFKENDHKHILPNLCETALSIYPNSLDLYKSVTNTLFIYAPLNKVTPIFIGLIQNHFDIYIGIPKPDSAQLHYELAEFLTLHNPHEAFLSYQKTIELGIKNAKVKKFTISAMNVISWALILNKKKEDIQPLVLQKIMQLAISSERFYNNLTCLLLEENKERILGDSSYEIILELTENFSVSNQIPKILKSFELFTKILEMYPDAIEVCLKVFSLYPQLNETKNLSKEELSDFYKTIGKKVLLYPELSKAFLEKLLQKAILLPPIESSYQLLYQLALAYPEHSLHYCDAVLSLANLLEIDPGLHEQFIQYLLKQNHYQKALHYYLQVKHLLTSSEIHEQFIDHIYQQKKAPTLEEEVIILEELENQPKNLRSTAQLMLLTNNPKSKLYDLFITQLANHNNETEIRSYYKLLQLFKDKNQAKQRKKILFQIGVICGLDDQKISEKKEKILDLCSDVIISYFKPCGKNIINSILDLLLPDVDIAFIMLQKLIEMPKLQTALLFFKEALKRSPNYYEKLLSAFPSVKSDPLHEQLVTLFLELDKFNLAFNYYQQHCSNNQSKALAVKLLSKIKDLSDHDFSALCLEHVQSYFELTKSLLNSNEKNLARQMLEKFSNFCLTSLLKKDLQHDQDILYPVDLLLTNETIASKVIKKLIEKNKLSSALFIFKKSLTTSSTQDYLFLMEAFPTRQYDEMMKILLEHGDLKWCIQHLLQQDYDPALSLRLLTRIHGLLAEDFEKFCLDHPKLCFEFAKTVLNHEKETETKRLVEDLLKNISSKINKHSSLYRKIIHALYQNTTLKLPDHIIKLFESLTAQFGDENVYLTGSRVLALINKKVTSSNDWDFFVICEASKASILLGEDGLKFWKSEKVPGLYTKIVGNYPEETIIEVFCVDPIPDKTIVEQLRLNAESRDFTVCAFLLNQYGILFDFFGGEEDAKNHRLRSIKPSLESFTTDPIRLLRAIKYRVNEFKWTSELKQGVVQWATPFQNIELDVRDHLYAVIIKHLSGLNETQKKSYIDLLIEEKLWKKLFLYEARIELRNNFKLDIPIERQYNVPMYVPQNPYNFFPQYTFPVFIPNPYQNNNNTPTLNLRPPEYNEDE